MLGSVKDAQQLSDVSKVSMWQHCEGPSMTYVEKKLSPGLCKLDPYA